MGTVADSLRATATGIAELMQELLTKHSRVEEVHNDPTSGVVYIGKNGWADLPPEGRHVQTRALNLFRRYAAVTKALFSGQSGEVVKSVAKDLQAVGGAIEQEPTWSSDASDVLTHALAALEKLSGRLDALYDPSRGTAVYVPDTNALIARPELDQWQFAAGERFTMVLLPAVAQELDQLKINHRNEDVRRKADGLIGRLKEYRRRGPLTGGVTLRKDVSTIIAIAVEPDFASSLPWLDRDNQDDRLLAGLLEVMRQFPHSPVTLVTRDINLQNKAEHAGFPFTEPPP